MNKIVFEDRKAHLISLIRESLSKSSITQEEKNNLIFLLEIIDAYSFDNKEQKKGVLTHAILDSIVLDYAFLENFIEFDQSL